MAEIEIYKSLNYGHREINDLLGKINKGKVLTEDEYKRLFIEIGLDKISTFDGSYESLKDLPNIHEIAAQVAMKYFDALRSEMIKLMTEGDAEVQANLDVHLNAYHDLLFNLEDGIFTLDEQFKNELKKEVDECIELLAELESQIKDAKENKSDINHKHTINDLSDIEDKFNQFELQLRTDYSLDTVKSQTHTHPKEVFNITKDDITMWNRKASLDHIQELRSNIQEIKNNYKTTEDVLVCINDLKDSLNEYVLREDIFGLLDTRAYTDHIHDIKDIGNLADYLDMKVNKEKNKVLIDSKLLSKIENLVHRQELLEAGSQQHEHGNLGILNSITNFQIDKWDSCIDRDEAKQIFNNEIRKSTLNDLVNNSFYTKEEIDVLIECSELATINKVELEERLNGLTFKPIKQEEFNALPEDEKINESIVYIVTDTPSYEQDRDTFVTGAQLEDRMLDILDKHTVITQDLLDNRLDGLKFKQVTAGEYNSLEREDGVLYVITDTVDIDMSVYLTKEDLEKRIGDPLDSINRPENPAEGLCYYDKTLKKPIWFNGEIWIDALGNPV